MRVMGTVLLTRILDQIALSSKGKPQKKARQENRPHDARPHDASGLNVAFKQEEDWDHGQGYGDRY